MRVLVLLASLVISLYLLFFVTPTASKQFNTAYINQPNTTISQSLQKLAEQKLTEGLEQYSAEQGVILVMDASDGSIKAVASTANLQMCETRALCKHAESLIFKDWQPGSVMKPLILAAAIEEGKVSPKSNFYDDGSVKIDGRVIQNATYRSYGKVDMQEIIASSINLGAIHILTQLGDNAIDTKARETWHHYLVDKYKFSQSKDLGGNLEELGYIRPPTGGRDLNFRYASSSFGLGLALTPTRLVAAYSALINGGMYHEPRVLNSDITDAQRILSESTSTTMAIMLTKTSGFNEQLKGYSFGGKTGTAPLPDGHGNFRKNKDSGTYVGYLAKGNERYTILVRLDAPVTTNFASYTARELWFDTVRQMVAQDIFAEKKQ